MMAKEFMTTYVYRSSFNTISSCFGQVCTLTQRTRWCDTEYMSSEVPINFFAVTVALFCTISETQRLIGQTSPILFIYPMY